MMAGYGIFLLIFVFALKHICIISYPMSFMGFLLFFFHLRVMSQGQNFTADVPYSHFHEGGKLF